MAFAGMSPGYPDGVRALPQCRKEKFGLIRPVHGILITRILGGYSIRPTPARSAAP